MRIQRWPVFTVHSKYLLDCEVLRVQDQEPNPKPKNQCTFGQFLWQLFGNSALAPHGGFMSLACASAGIRYGLGMSNHDMAVANALKKTEAFGSEFASSMSSSGSNRSSTYP